MNQTNAIMVALVCAGMMAAAPMMVGDAEATFDYTITCGADYMSATITLSGVSESYNVFVTQLGGGSPYVDTNGSGPTIQTGNVLTPYTTYEVNVNTHDSNETVRKQFTCPPSEAPTSSKYYTFSLSAQCVHPGTAIDISWTKADHDAWYSMTMTDPDGNTPHYITRTTDTSYSTRHTLQVETTYGITATAHQTDEDPITVYKEVTCERPPFEASVTCNSGTQATISWKWPPAGTTHFKVLVNRNSDNRLAYDSGNVGGSSIKVGSGLTPETGYDMSVAAYNGGTALATSRVSFTCPNTPPGVNAGDDFTWSPGIDVYLSGKIVDKDAHPTTKSWSCSLGNQTLPVSCPLCDNPVTTPAHITFAYGQFRMPSPLPNGAQVTCTITASDGYDTVSDRVVITADSSWVISDDGASQARDANDGGGDVTGDTTNNGGESGQTGQTGGQSSAPPGGGGGESGGGSGGFFIPFFQPTTTQSTQSEPEPEPLPISNGTMPNIRMASVPYMERWNGTTITPFQCNATAGGSIRLNPIYDGMNLIHGTFNVTDSVTGDMWEAPLDTTVPTNATATHNVTVHTTATYNHTQIRPYTVLLDIHAGGLDWSIGTETLSTFQDIFDTVDVLARYQYGSVLWSGMGASCFTPD